MTFKSMSIGEAVRVHMREESYRSKYRLARSLYRIRKTRMAVDIEHYLREALVARARWSALAEIIEAEERRVAPKPEHEWPNHKNDECPECLRSLRSEGWTA